MSGLFQRFPQQSNIQRLLAIFIALTGEQKRSRNTFFTNIALTIMTDIQ